MFKPHTSQHQGTLALKPLKMPRKRLDQHSRQQQCLRCASDAAAVLGFGGWAAILM
jgi:hypothetical protein